MADPAEMAALELEIRARQGVEKVLRGTHDPTMASINQIVAMAWLLDVILPPDPSTPDQSEDLEQRSDRLTKEGV